MIKPIFSEKSLNEAKLGRFTFKVDRSLSKFQIKKLVTDLFNVNVISVLTLNYKGGVRRTIKGARVSTASFKKAIVVLKQGEKISLWDAEKKEEPKKAKLKAQKAKSLDKK